MAETAIMAVLSKFGELAANEAKVLVQVGEDMMLLRDRLEWLQAFISDTDRKRRAGTDGLTRVWVRQTRDVAFQAEDALDEFFYKVDLRSQGYHGWKMCRAFLMGFGNQILVRHRLSDRMRRIKSRLTKISENQMEYKIEHTPLAELTSCTTAIAAWRGDDYMNSVGLDADVQTLEEMLLDETERQLMFISIVGESGVGKRTLGQVISYKMTGKFNVLIRLTVPREFSPQRVLKQIHSYIEKQCGNDDSVGEGSAGCRIRGLLADKRYLLVLSGIGSKTMLNCLRASLPDNNNGSRVMLTLDGENEEVAWHGNTMNRDSINGVHQLSRLDKGRSAELFRSRAFKKEESDGESRNYDQDVYDITGGYPLAIVVLAGLLRFKERPGQWEAVLQQLSPSSSSGMEGAAGGADQADGEANKENRMQETQQLHLSTRTTMERVLWSSFEDLPNDLKSCFLYFAAFSNNIAYYADELVRMWIGEGFVKPHKGKTMEELGHGYLKELALRCLVDILEEVGGVITDVKIHPRLHGLLHSEVREAGFVEVHDTNDVLVSPSVRRLSFRSFDNKYVTFPKKLPKLRSFICRVEESELSEDSPCNDLEFLCGSKFLRLIYLNGLKLKSLPRRIGGLIHLRYLYVRCKGLRELPSSIKKLINLQTLDIRDTGVHKIDPGFWKITTLRHVLADDLTLPGTLEGDDLQELQTLHGVKPAGEGQWTQHNCPLRKMTKLRSLQLHGIDDHKHGAALETALNKMCLLVHLKLKGDMIPSCVFTVEGLQYLETVELDGAVRWPNVLSDLRKDRPNLVEITLTERNDAALEKAGFEFSEDDLAYLPSATYYWALASH